MQRISSLEIGFGSCLCLAGSEGGRGKGEWTTPPGSTTTATTPSRYRRRATPWRKFVGDTRTVHDDDGGTWLEGDAIVVYDPEQEEQAQLQLKVGDAVYLTGARKGNAAEIVRIDGRWSPDPPPNGQIVCAHTRPYMGPHTRNKSNNIVQRGNPDRGRQPVVLPA
jgi:hypothetical protein